MCGIHKHPIIGIKSSSDFYSQTYDSDYECDYECNEEDEYGCVSNCCYREDNKLSKSRTVVIFNKESSEKIKHMDVIETKNFLVKEDIVKKVNSRYSV